MRRSTRVRRIHLAALLSGLLIATGLLGACGDRVAPAGVAPTVAPAFSHQPQPVTTTAGYAGPIAPTPTPLSPMAPVEAASDQRELPLFDDRLVQGWSLEQSYWTRYAVAASDLVRSGRYAIRATPERGYGALFFSVERGARQRYPRESIVGVRFWVNGGAYAIGPSDLIVAVVGSNALPYYQADDTSARPSQRIADDRPAFAEQRLYTLGPEQGIPANTWAEVVVWLADGAPETAYTYVTGVYIKNDELFVKPYYVDDVRLVLADR
ncbi:MAG: hypothetical protein N2378_04675 [Chloroflexaceae bacterium]|nr:hypothetical protein [Chloroflexaceae bacterium]